MKYKKQGCSFRETEQVNKVTFYQIVLHFKCKCNGSNKVKVVKAFGCAKGGVPDCPRQVRPFCKDGTRLTTNFVMRWRGETAGQRAILGNGYKGCACPDGIMPRSILITSCSCSFDETTHSVLEIISWKLPKADKARRPTKSS